MIDLSYSQLRTITAILDSARDEGDFPVRVQITPVTDHPGGYVEVDQYTATYEGTLVGRFAVNRDGEVKTIAELHA